jgi:hypothetical protein
MGAEGGGGGVREEVGKRGEMNQTLYAPMNKNKKKSMNISMVKIYLRKQHFCIIDLSQNIF